MLFLYRFLCQLIKPIYQKVMIPRRLKDGKEDPARLNEKFGFASMKRPQGKLIWIHAASVGETLSILKLVREIQSLYHDVQILVTSGTVTSARVVADKFPKTIIHQFAPMDFQDSVTRFLDHWKPDLALWVESELWPNMIFSVKERKIPLVSVNVRFSDRSLRRWCWFKGFFLDLLQCFEVIFVQTKSVEKKLKFLGVRNVFYKGNLKFAADPLDAPQDLLDVLEQSIQNRKVWVASSTHEGEEELILEVHEKLKTHFPDLLTILIPRHPDRAQKIMKLLGEHKETFQLFSASPKPSETTDVLIVDQVGLLGVFYRLSPLVFVGGSFVGVGGHNIIEPAQLDSVIFHGRYMHNFREVLSQFNQFQGTIEVGGSQELASALQDLFLDPKKVQDLIKKSKAAVVDQTDVLNQIMTGMNPYLKKALL